ncbi:hypothetical protein HAX54_005635, partial [Datura stramonium]|nr:hypothetical protein [Datura stramonium]
MIIVFSPIVKVRFPEVAEPKHVWWLEIQGTIRAGVLTPWTSYAAYSPWGELSVGVIGVELNKRFAFLVPDGGVQRRNGYEESIYTLPYDVEDDPGLPEDDYEESVYTPPSNVD